MSNEHSDQTHPYPWKFNLSPLSREFEVFSAIFHAQSLSKASEKLDLDQGNISKTLKNLETQMGLKLFVRHRQGVRPTDTAKALERALQEVRHIWDSAKKGAFSGVHVQTLRLGAHATIAQTYFPFLFQKLSELRPDSYLEVELADSYDITRKVMARELELGVVVNPIESEDLIIKPLSREKIELCGLDPECEQASLIRNPRMIHIQKLLKNTEFRKVLDVEDYDVAASICEMDLNYWTIIPSTVRERHPSLKVIGALKEVVNVKLITYPGSPLVKDFTQLRKGFV